MLKRQSEFFAKLKLAHSGPPESKQDRIVTGLKAALTHRNDKGAMG
ncbi:hypothetical protein GCM10007989_10310 [Devosia pacifica]|uniref:Uncharacterized protein n=1 Tax=Devosia pacifica TaxID=1335967 RepID=A0A918VPE0_9HYPH|nr:hypothetical protein GCM10007989_10310 [Devosia pacifica]